MKIELMKVLPRDLKIGDEWHMDEYSKHGERRIVRSETGQIWKVIAPPFTSTNTQLFWDNMSNECIVVPVQYHDGARGSRLFDTKLQILIRRDLHRKG